MARPQAKTKAPRRKPGRPQTALTSVRDALLDSALRLFAIEGIAQCNMRKIAIEAHTTPAMIHYHFGDKDGLIKAVVDERVRQVTSVMHEVMTQKSLPAKTMLFNFMQSFIRITGLHPWVPKLVLREVYNEHGSLRESFMENFARNLSQLLLGLVKRAQEEGSLRKDLDASAMTYAFLSLAIYPVLSSPMVPDVLGLACDTESMLKQASRNFDVFMTGVAVQ
ncbi:MAG: TetR/AcrR family transcriptional regulator [Arenimonas sp.]